MRTTKVVAITMPPRMAKEAARLAKKQNRTMSELMREAFRRYQREEEIKPSSEALRELASAIAALRESAKKKGLHRLTAQEIDDEISAHRTRPGKSRLKPTRR